MTEEIELDFDPPAVNWEEYIPSPDNPVRKGDILSDDDGNGFDNAAFVGQTKPHRNVIYRRPI